MYSYDLLFIFYLIVIILFEVCAQYLYKISYNNNKIDIFNNVFYFNKYNYLKNVIVLVGVIFYAISGFFAYKLLRYGELGVINVIWHLIHFFVLFIVGYLFLNETLTIKKIIGSVFGIISLLILMSDTHSQGHH
jgi:multidrug transporter EmrE-like cation transporter